MSKELFTRFLVETFVLAALDLIEGEDNMKIMGSKKAALNTARSCELGWRILGTYFAKTEEEKSRVEVMTIAWLRVVRSMENGEPCYVGQALIQSASETYARKMAKRLDLVPQTR